VVVVVVLVVLVLVVDVVVVDVVVDVLVVDVVVLVVDVVVVVGTGSSITVVQTPIDVTYITVALGSIVTSLPARSSGRIAILGTTTPTSAVSVKLGPSPEPGGNGFMVIITCIYSKIVVVVVVGQNSKASNKLSNT